MFSVPEACTGITEGHTVFRNPASVAAVPEIDIEAKEAALYGTQWWADNVARLRAHQAHREIKTIEPFLPDGA